MRKSLFLLFIVILYTTDIEAQTTDSNLYSVNGQLIDSLSNEPVPFVTIGISSDQTPTQFFSVAAGDVDGKFEIQFKMPGNYVLTIQSITTITLLKPFTLTENNRQINFGKLLLQEKTQLLNEVTVTAQKPLIKVEIDKLIYNMENDPEAKVSNTLEMLRKVPLLTVDGDDKIKLKGSSNFVIYMNGKPSNMLRGQNITNVLSSMPANTIKNIEVITDPGARYDAEGIGGIININTVRNLFQGFQGSVSANTSTFGGFGNYAYLTAKTGKLGLTGNISYSNMYRPWTKSSSVTENSINEQHYKEKNDERSRIKKRNHMNGSLEANYEFDSLRLLSLSVDYYSWKSKVVTERVIEMFDKSGDLAYGYKSDGNNKSVEGSTGISLDYQRSMQKKGELLTFSYRFYNSPDNRENFSYASDLTGVMPLYLRLNQWYDNNAHTSEHTGQIDYANPLTTKHSIETGLKYIFRENISKVKQYETDGDGISVELPPNMNNDFKHISNIYAAYAGYAFKLPKFGFRTGVRVEETMQDITFILAQDRNFNVDYFNAVPSITASYQLKQNQQLRLGYNQRIIRPNIWTLNPYVNDTDPYNISYGNPHLIPEKSNSFNLDYSYFAQKYTLNASASYSYINNSIESYMFIDPANPDVKQRTYDNIGRNQRAYLFFTAGWVPNRMLRFNLSGELSFAELNSAKLNISNNGLTGSLEVNAQVTLPKDLRFNAYGYYSSGYTMLQGKELSFYSMFFTVSKEFLNRKLTVSLRCFNPFIQYTTYKRTTKNEYFETKTSQFVPTREVRIMVAYRFGTMKEDIRKVQRTISNDDVKSGGGNDTGSGATGR